MAEIMSDLSREGATSVSQEVERIMELMERDRKLGDVASLSSPLGLETLALKV
jgi:hypothetical protein